VRRSLALLAALFTACPLAAQAPATFQTPSGGRIPLRVLEADGRVLVSVADVAAALEGTVAFDERTRSFEVRVKGRTAVFGTDTPVAVVDTRLVTLAAPARAEGSLAFADAEFLTRVLGPLTGVSFSWDAGRRSLVAARAESPEITVETTVADVGDATKVIFRFSRPPQYRVEKTEDAVVLKFPGVTLLPGAPETLSDSPRVARVNVRGSEASVALREKGLSTNVYPLGSPPRLVVDVARVAAAGEVPAPAVPARAWTVVIDPGHGGTEEGAKGPDGLLEKDAMLALSKTVQDVLVRRGYRVVTTRSSDVGVGLEDRAASANAAKADVFISLHANASRTPTAHGTEVFYLSLDASDRAAALLAESENLGGSASGGSAEKNAAARDLDLILWDLAQNQHLAASARLAEIIQADFNRLLGVTTRGVKQAPFRVLIGVNAPAVLVEVAFITNPDEERRLNSDEFRRQTAETLAGSLDNFFRTGAAVPPVPYAPKAPGRP
jgi:N-acetylmuramoyl-L-alanine amidase